ncbi:WYL domain-containing protein [Salinispora tropica]|uniref:WYL domain-containing protein n=1 Tax=Salinispora tropica TaxID=168695 RepID=UPI00048BD2B8
MGRQAAALRAYISATPDRRVARPAPATTSALVAAVADRRRVLVTHSGESDEERDAEVNPWAVIVRYGRWYLLCHAHRADAIRTYRIDWIQAVRAPRAGRRPLRPGRQHPKPHDVRPGVAGRCPL